MIQNMLLTSAFLTGSLLFAIPLRADNKMIVVAHEDDEAIIAAGVICTAIKAGHAVHVIIMTNGDYSNSGAVRIAESVNALIKLGMSTDNIHFLGFGDSSLMSLFNQVDPSAVLSSHAGFVQTYGNENIPNMGGLDFHYKDSIGTGFPQHSPYSKASVLGDLQSLISKIRPSEIYTHSLMDTHSDHQATFLFLNAAIIEFKKNNPDFSPVVHQAMVHGPDKSNSTTTWPGQGADVATPDPAGDFDFTANMSWNQRESKSVPADFNNYSGEIVYKGWNDWYYWGKFVPSVNKMDVLNSYLSQSDCSYIPNFVKTDEVFWTRSYSNLAPLASVTTSSESVSTGQQGVKAVDGIRNGTRPGISLYQQYEWASLGESTGAWIQLEWPTLQTVNSINLCGRQCSYGQISTGILSFSDGSNIVVDSSLPFNGSVRTFNFNSKHISWVRFTVASTPSRATNIGLTEFEVYNNSSLPEIGNNSFGDSIDRADSDISLSRFYCNEEIALNNIYANIDSGTSGLIKAAIYDDVNNLPRNLIGKTIELTRLNPQLGWHCFPMTQQVILLPGNFYWIAVWGAMPDLAIAASSGGKGRYKTVTYGEWPSILTGTTPNSKNHCLYGN